MRVGEAGKRALADGSGAVRDLRPARIAAQVDVQLTAAVLEPYEADEIAAVGRDRVDVVPLPLDHPVERVRHPAGAVDRRADAVGELLPALGRRAGRLRLDRCAGAAASAAAAGEGYGKREQEECPYDPSHGQKW